MLCGRVPAACMPRSVSIAALMREALHCNWSAQGGVARTMAWRLRAAAAMMLLSCCVCVRASTQLPQSSKMTEGAVVRGYVYAQGVVEASGLQASRRQPGVLWTHNDDAGGASGHLFAIDTLGASLVIRTYPLMQADEAASGVRQPRNGVVAY